MSDDPSTKLVETLKTLFDSVAIRNGKYLIEPIQQLKEEVDRYNPDSKTSFFSLLRAFKACSPYFAQRQAHFNELIHNMGQIAKHHGIEHQELKVFFVELQLNYTNKSPPQEKPLIPWLSEQSHTTFNRMTDSEQTDVLVKHCQHQGFSNKLSQHLQKHPEFLFKLATKSMQNFNKIAGCRLNLYLTDTQMAKAIMLYLPKFCESLDTTTPDMKLISQKIDGILSNGCSINRLMRNSDAKAILEQSPWFQNAEPSPRMAP